MFSPDGGRLAGRTGGTAAIWDAWTGDELVTISGHSGEVFGVSFSRDGTRIATGSEDGTARVWDAATGEELVRLSGHDGLVALVDFSPDGTRLLTGGGDGTARVWDISDTAGAELWSQRVASDERRQRGVRRRRHTSRHQRRGWRLGARSVDRSQR